MINTRQRQVFRVLWAEGKLSRSELHKRTGMTPNGVGTLAEAMLRDGLLRECPVRTTGRRRRRPRVPLEIHPTRRHVIGLALEPGRVNVCRLGLAGALLEHMRVHECADPTQLIPAAASLLQKHRDRRTLAVGVSVTGFVDAEKRTLLFSGAMKGGPAADLSPIFDAAGELPIVLENDMHALARALAAHARRRPAGCPARLDRRRPLGAAILVNGRPNRGCAMAPMTWVTRSSSSRPSAASAGTRVAWSRIVSSPFLESRDAAHNGRALPAAPPLAGRANASIRRDRPRPVARRDDALPRLRTR